MAEMQRAKTASDIVSTGIPDSSAALMVHCPVPFCPARSIITSTIGSPVTGSLVARILPVTSMRNESKVTLIPLCKRLVQLVGS